MNLQLVALRRVVACLGLLAVAVLAAAPVLVRADNVTFCVSNDAELRAALLNATFLPTTIKLVQGSYELGGTVWDGDNAAGVTADGTKVLGGYAANCAGRDIERGNTVLNDTAGPLTGPMIFIHGSLTLEGLTWHTEPYINANNIGYEDLPPLYGAGDLPPDSEVLIRRDTFIGGAPTVDWGQDDDVGGTIRMVDSLIIGADPTVCAFDVEAEAGGAIDVELINNTIYAATCAYNHYSDGWGFGRIAVYAYNNIFDNASPPDIFTQTDAWILVDNMLNHYQGAGPIQETGTLTGDPELDSSYRPIESPPSPVINSASNNVRGGLPSSDLDGGARIIGSTVDRGAYESGLSDELLLQVTNEDDSGAGSLRSAINSANTNGVGIITFDIGAGCGPHVITLDSALPDLGGGIIVNGYTQTGSSPNDLDVGDDAAICVILEAGSGSVTHAFRVAGSAAGDAAVSIKGLAFSGFGDAAIDLQGGAGHYIAGNHFGGSVGGRALQPNGIDIRIDVDDSTVGGDDAGTRNIIGDATDSGIVLQANASFNQIVNNYIGVGWNAGTSAYTNRGNGLRGLRILGSSNTVSANLIGDNVQAGILIDGVSANDSTIDGNFIGTDPSGVVLGNGNAGIHVSGTPGDAPLSTTIRYNRIANNGDQGIWIDDGAFNRIRKNSIYANGGLGIDLATAGVLPNDDDGVTVTLANEGQNYPVLDGALGGFTVGRVSGTLTTIPGDYTVDFYRSSACDGSGYGEGRTWIRGATVTVPSPQSGDQGVASFAITLHVEPPAIFTTGTAITTTATDPDGNTSEFSQCVLYVNDTIFADGFDPAPQ